MVEKKKRDKARAARKKEKKANRPKGKVELTGEIKSLQVQVAAKQSAHESLMKERSSRQDELNALHSKKQDLLKSKEHSEYLLEDQKEETSKYKAMLDGKVEVENYMKKREGALWKRVKELETRIGRSSRREAEEWFGPGPYKVELILEYPQAPAPDRAGGDDPSTWPRVTAAVVIDLAPLDLMP